ncbi:MAG: choice-of-anchor J domain-containing protein [Candidatus Cloacimonetes bacterium]|nr:choice-of-anchor J domain-containing protein [Candidatus Cloacimonadota bacterium]
MRRSLLLLLLLCNVINIGAEVISIGSGTVLNQGLPIEPLARYSYSQQLFMATEIGVGGTIDAVQFQYNVASQFFYEGNKQLSIWLGHSDRSTMNSWVSTDSLYPVFSGTLSLADFSDGIPGTGWLQISLTQAFLYDGIHNLVLAVDENGAEYGSTSDDFYCTNSAYQRAIQFQHQTINPDPANPPATGFTLKTHRSNLRINIQAQHYIPVQPIPLNGATGVPVCTELTWVSQCSSFSLSFGSHPDSLALIEDNIPGSMWQLEGSLQQNKQYYWQVIGFSDEQPYPSPVWSFTTAGEPISAPQYLSGFYGGQSVQLSWQAPLIGIAQSYRVYRNTALLDETQLMTYSDPNVIVGFTYYYHVTAINSTFSESIVSNTISVTIPNIPPNMVINQGFEALAPFSSAVTDWQTIDLDGSHTWSWDNINFPGEGEAFSWLCFCPSQTTPPLNGLSPYSGSQMLMAMSSLNPPNNDWLISPAIHLGQSASLTFKARSAVADFGLERLRVLVSTTDTNPTSFTAINQGNYLAVPAVWTNYPYDLSVYAGQRIYLAWNCISVDAFALFLDDIQLSSAGAWVSNSDDYLPAPAFNSYPNPAKSSFSINNKSGEPFSLELYDIKGRKLYTGKGLSNFDSNIISSPLPSGIYFLRIHQNGKRCVLKQVLAK